MAVVPAAAQALAVLQYLGTQAQPAAAAAVSRELGLPRSTTYHLLDTLIRAGERLAARAARTAAEVSRRLGAARAGAGGPG